MTNMNVQEFNGQLDHFLDEVISDMTKYNAMRRSMLAALEAASNQRKTPNAELDMVESLGWTCRDLVRAIGDLKAKLAMYYSDWKAMTLIKL